MAYRYALAGNPNCGKTTLFNTLTGSTQYVGNWPGVTVEKKEGRCTLGGTESAIVDLPGIYSLSPYSMEEIVTRNFVIDEHPDLILDVVDATNLERNLYLTLQLAELGCPVVIALNMMDMVEKRGDVIDCAKLSAALNIPVIPISASKNTNIQKLMSVCAHEVAHAKDKRNHFDRHENLSKRLEFYEGDLKDAIKLIEDIIGPVCKKKTMPLRWCAVKVLEKDAPTLEALELSDSQLSCVDSIIEDLQEKGIDCEMVVADQKYKYICKACELAVKKKHGAEHLSFSDRIDLVVTNKYLAIPLFFALLLGIFYITFGAVGSYLTSSVDFVVNDWFSGWLRDLLMGIGTADWAVGLVCDGVLKGLGAVLSFFPQILLLFFFLSILEDSGYMARAAFIMDRALHKIGLSGKSFVPMLMGFGCTVPAVMSARTLETEKDRRLTVMLTPFMSCSAKMPVYSLFIAAFFPKNKGLVVMSLYLLGMLVAIACAFILQKTVLKGGHAAFVMELPPYRMPTAKTLTLHLWERIKDFFSKAGTVLLGASIVVWFCQYFNFSLQHVANSEESILGVIGSFIAPVFAPLGFGDWKSSVSMLSGLIARESIVGTMGILHGTGSEAVGALTQVLSSVYTPLSAYSFMVFALLFIPCIAAVSAIRREMNSAKWTLGTLGFQAAVAWIVTFVIYQAGRLIV